MVCCALISMLLAGLIWPVRTVMTRFKPGALEWRMAAPDMAASYNRFSLTGRIRSFGFAFEGLGYIIRHEHNARIHLVAAAIVTALGVMFQINRIDWMILCAAISSVWFAEAINSAFEYICDLVSPEKNEKVKRAKDIAAGAVLITAGFAVIIGVLLFAPYAAALMGHENLLANMPICRA